MRRVLSLWLPAFAIERRRRRSAPEGRPLVLLRQEGNRLLLAAVDEAAAARGLRPGLGLADARALVPELASAPSDPRGEAEDLGRLADWAGRYTPWTALDSFAEPGGAAGLWLEITGCAHLFGGEAALAADLLARLGRFGLSGRAGIADTPGAAWALARFGPGAAFCILPSGEERAALAPLPPAALRLSAGCCELLARLGLSRIGDFLDLPPALLEPRAGPEVARRLGQALGRLPEPLSPRRPQPVQEARLLFGEPIGTAGDLARGLDHLLRELAGRLESAGLGARRLELTLYRADGSLARSRLGTSRPSRDPDHLRRLFARKLDELDPGFGLDAMSLAALLVEPLSALQLALAGENPAARPQSDLPALLDRLGARLGLEAITRQGPRASHLPERAVRSLPPLSALPAESWPPGRPRPLRLFARPEPVEATALLPDQPPVQFRWRRVLHRVARAEGPERLTAEWWHGAAEAEAPPRDYFRVEDEDGRRFWLFRRGAAWFLAGLFA